MTVSRVVRGNHNVRPQTAKRVKDAIRQAGYKPDPTMSALAAYRILGGHTRGDSNLAFLDRDETEYSASTFEGLREEAKLHGYSVEHIALRHSKRHQRQLARILINRGVRGLLFGPSDEEWTFTGWDFEHFAMVSLGALTHTPAMHSVCMHYFSGAFSACRHAQEKGCHRIGFAVEPRLEYRTGHQWLGGYAAALNANQLHVYTGDWPVGTEFKKWCKREKIDAILAVQPSLMKLWPGTPDDCYLLNDSTFDSPVKANRYGLDPKQIGAGRFTLATSPSLTA